MLREQSRRSHKLNTAKPPSDGDVTGVEGEVLDLRAGQHKLGLGSNPRDILSPATNPANRYKKAQAQKFSEHTPEAREARNAELLDTSPFNTEQPNPTPWGSAVNSTADRVVGEIKKSRGRKNKNAKMQTTAAKTTTERHQAPRNMPSVDSGASDKPTVNQRDEQPKTHEPSPENFSTSKDSALSHAHTSALEHKQPSQLRHGHPPIASATSTSKIRRKQKYGKNITDTLHTPNIHNTSVDGSDVVTTQSNNATTPSSYSGELISPADVTLSGNAPVDISLADIAPQSDVVADPVVAPEHRAPDKVANKGSNASSSDSASTDNNSVRKRNKLRFDDTATSADASNSSKARDLPQSPKHNRLRKKLEKAQHKAYRSADKLQKTQDNLPKKRVLRIGKEFDPQKGKMKPRLRFEEKVKTQREHIKEPLITRPIKAGANVAVGIAHTKVFQVQEENVGVKATHKGELLAEGGLRHVRRRVKTAPYRRVEKLRAKTDKLNVKASYRKALHDNPELANKPLSRMMQKRRIKREYAKATREAGRAGEFVARGATKVKVAVSNIVTRTKAVVANPKMLFSVGVLALVIILLFGTISACTSMASSIGQTFVAMSYLAEEEDIDDAALFYSELEADLQMRIANIQDEWAGFDEYRINVDPIGHNPLMLMAFLTAVYHDFTFTEIEATLHEIFAEQYQLEIVPEVEIRARLETRTGIGFDEDGYPYSYTYTIEVEYEWHILNVTLASHSFFDVINERMTSDQRQHYALLMQSRGFRQIIGSPFDFNWLPFVSSHYGWRVHPISGGKDRHLGVDIALPTGTPILAAHSGTVTFAGNMGGYGLVVFINDGNGIETRYAHCDTILVSAGQWVEAGDVIATVGSTGNSTGPHLHFEIIRNRRHLNPIFFALIGDMDSGGLNFGFPGAVLDDEQFARLIFEAERLLGIAYVWGGSSPSQGFDCSGFVSYLLRAAGIADVGRLTAQGLYNISTRVSPSDARPGDLIFFEGTFASYRTVTHVGFYIGNGYMLHTGSNPAGVEFTSINTNFWQRHFFAFARI